MTVVLLHPGLYASVCICFYCRTYPRKRMVRGRSSPAPHSLGAELQRSLFHDIEGGLTSGLVSIFFGLSFASVIFSGPLTPWLGQGIAITFLTTAIAAVLFASLGSLPFAIAGPDSSTSAVLAVLAVGFSSHLLSTGMPADAVFAPTLAMITLTTLLTGVFLFTLGALNGGRAVRFVPFPVVGGFLGATGWLMMAGALRVICDLNLDLASLQAFSLDTSGFQLLSAVAMALAIMALRKLMPGPLGLPVLLTLGVGLFHAIVYYTGNDIAALQRAGWTFPEQATSGLSVPDWGAWLRVPHMLSPRQVGEIVAVAFVTTIAMLLNTSGVELHSRREANLDNDLKALGIVNAATAVAGGYVSCVSLSRSNISYSSGARGRVGGFVIAGMALAMIVAGTSHLALVPKFVLGGLLLFLGAELLSRWVVSSARQLPLADYVSLLTIALVIANLGYVAGVLAGIVIGCATFAVSASRVNAIKFSFDGTQYRSSLDRSVSELEILSNFGGSLQCMSLHSYLFFGTSNRLYRYVRDLIERGSGCRYLVFDFRLVTGMDSSASQSFLQIKAAAEAVDARIVLAGLAPDLQRNFEIAGIIDGVVRIEPDLDSALEWCEDEIISEQHRTQAERQTLKDWLTADLGNAEQAEILAGMCKPITAAAGTTIARQGEPSDVMHFILRGRVGIVVTPPHGEPMRMRSLGPGTTVGEMGLISGQPRTASIEAEMDTDLYELDVHAFKSICAQHPALAQSLLSYIVRIMSERLAFANRTIGVLRR